MNRRRLVAAIFFSVVIVAVLALIVVTEILNSAATVTVFRLNKDVQRGQPFNTADVDKVPVAAKGNEFNFVNPDQLPPSQGGDPGDGGFPAGRGQWRCR
jgi:hypothetical protein